VVVGYTAINLLFDYILQPRVMGQALDLSAAAIVLSIFVWTWLIGPLGAILAVPLTMVVRAILREVPSAHWLAALIGPVGVAATDPEADASQPSDAPQPPTSVRTIDR
jgi:predicted PurR-regulated permease PerM